MSSIDEALKGLVSDGQQFAKGQLVDLVQSAKSDEEVFVRTMGEKVEKYTIDLASQAISIDEYKDLMAGVASLQKIQLAGLSVEAKARAEKVARGVQDLAINALCKLIKPI